MKNIFSIFLIFSYCLIFFLAKKEAFAFEERESSPKDYLVLFLQKDSISENLLFKKVKEKFESENDYVYIKIDTLNNVPKTYDEAFFLLKKNLANLIIWENPNNDINNSRSEYLSFVGDTKIEKTIDKLYVFTFRVRNGCLPKNFGAVSNLIKSLNTFSFKEFDVSLNYIEKIQINQNACFDDIMFQKAFCNYMLGDDKKAIEISKKLLETNPSNLKALWILSDIGSEEKKEDYFKRILLTSGYPDTYEFYGDLKLRQEKYNEAFKLYKKSLQLDSTNSEAYLGLGNASRMIDRNEEAYKYFLKAIEFDSTNVEAYYWVGNLLFNFEISLDPNKVINEAQLEDAQWYFEKVIEFRPDLSEVQFNLGVLKALNSNYTKAIEKFLQAVKYDSTSRALGHLSLAYLKLKDFENADKYYKKAFASDSVYVKILMDTSEVSILEKYYKHQPKSE